MNTTRSLHLLASRVWLTLAVAVCTVAGLPVHAASSFPNSPLMTGGAGVPPNVLLILDDSGSMSFVKMPYDVQAPGYCNFGGQCGLQDNPDDRSYVNNTIYYNPAKTYQPWRTASTDPSARLGNADYTSVASHPTSASTGDGALDLRGDPESVFYVPKSGVANPGTDPANYVRYSISSSGSVVTATNLVSLTQSIGEHAWAYTTINVASGTTQLVIRISGNSNKSGGDADLYVRRSANPTLTTYDYRSQGNTSTESITIDNPASGAWNIGIYNYDQGSGSRSVQNNTLTVDAMGPGTPTGRTQAAELQNFANWYQYDRTRSKTAKAGASEAFGTLGSQYRVGFDTIWNRNGSGGNVSGSTPTFPIPVGTTDGLFSGGNRTNFYSYLQGAGASNGTPLHGALQRAARYFKTDDPWKDSSGAMLTCRQNYSILTTDGYWNTLDGYDPAVGNSDSGSTYGDRWSDTLADVAYEYWSKDLRTDLTNNVRASSADPATWQHMVTFGVSIGQQGFLDPTLAPPTNWTDPWKLPKSNDPSLDGTTDRRLSYESRRRIDDLWHATLNGHGRFVVASDPETFKNALASALAAIDARTSSGSNIASTSTKTDSTTLTFVAGFTSSTWVGDLVASPFNATLTGVSDSPIWRLSKTFATGKANETYSSRTILTSFNGTAQAFANLKSLSSSSDKAIFERATGSDAVTLADNIDYLSGVQTKEIGRTNGTLRPRLYPFGDIVDSSPAYVADTNTVYVGANDGMLHGVDAATGKVLFSYVPRGIDYSALASLSSTSYVHRYFVDGQMDVTKKANGYTKNVLVGALGRGGKGVFALDVTSPTSMAAGKVLWDNTFQPGSGGGAADNDMGYVLGPVRIRKANDGKMYALVPNGIESANGSAVLFVYELGADGSLVSTTKLAAGSSGGNGLMGLGLADLNQDGMVDTVYGGDLKGNVWKWDFSGTSLPTTATKLFQATDSSGTPQPITGGLGLARDSSGFVYIGFGTGRYISSSDVPNNPGYVAQTQSLYGILDSGTLVQRTDLQQRSIPYIGVDSQGRPARGFENYSALSSGKKGWFLDLGVPSPAANGERVVTSPTVVNSAMFLSSIIPAAGSDCSGALGSGYINVINIFTGTSPSAGSYFTDGGRLSGSNGGSGSIGSVNIGGGMPTQVNVTSNLATAGNGTGTGDDTAGSSSGTGGGGTNAAGSAGTPQRVNWRELVPTN